MNLKIKVEKRHFQRATSYTSITNCPLAMALKEIFSTQDVFVGVGDAQIEKNDITFKGWTEHWDDSDIVVKIRHYIGDPDDPSFEPFEVELVGVPEELISKQEALL